MTTKSWLGQNNIFYIEKKISDEGVADELFNMGHRTTPVVVVKTSAPVARGMVEGIQTIVGYNPSKLAEAFNKFKR